MVVLDTRTAIISYMFSEAICVTVMAFLLDSAPQALRRQRFLAGSFCDAVCRGCSNCPAPPCPRLFIHDSQRCPHCWRSDIAICRPGAVCGETWQSDPQYRFFDRFLFSRRLFRLHPSQPECAQYRHLAVSADHLFPVRLAPSAPHRGRTIASDAVPRLDIHCLLPGWHRSYLCGAELSRRQ